MKNSSTIKINSQKYKRIPHGKESFDWEQEVCFDCGAKLNKYHTPGCDHEECPKCGEQLISCDCDIHGSWDAISDGNVLKDLRASLQFTYSKPTCIEGKKIIHYLAISFPYKDKNNKNETGVSVYGRIPYGKETLLKFIENECNCGAKRGEYHTPQCGREECPECGKGLFNCKCEKEEIFEGFDDSK